MHSGSGRVEAKADGVGRNGAPRVPNNATNPNLAVCGGRKQAEAPAGAPRMRRKIRPGTQHFCILHSAFCISLANTGTIALAAHWPPNMPLLPELGWLLGGSIATNMALLRSCFAPVLFHRKQRGTKSCQEAAAPGGPARIALHLRRESRMTLGCITQWLQIGTKTHRSHLLDWQGRERGNKRLASK